MTLLMSLASSETFATLLSLASKDTLLTLLSFASVNTLVTVLSFEAGGVSDLRLERLMSCFASKDTLPTLLSFASVGILVTVLSFEAGGVSDLRLERLMSCLAGCIAAVGLAEGSMDKGVDFAFCWLEAQSAGGLVSGCCPEAALLGFSTGNSLGSSEGGVACTVSESGKYGNYIKTGPFRCQNCRISPQ